ncbi:MAG: penicillin-binding protein 1A [Alphaproteobacteria bacterium]|nr:penicillin-binding protein 1A [Alphaproteobacteria bacterium]MCK5658652.1 penicillin-binding protein 1A [Alphaproteobacteria bacterium]
MKSDSSSNIWITLFSIGFLCLVAGVGFFVAVLYYFGQGLPDYRTLTGYEPPIVTRAYASDGRLLAEFATEKRVYVPVSTVPPLVIHAFLSAEDKSFYTHPGIDISGIIRAAAINFSNVGGNRRKVGASTITQQVAKNFFLSGEVTYKRKIREAILAFRIEQTYTKDQILQLYLNEIFLGAGVYGIAAASLEYFNKPLDELTLEEAAYLAALPKAPNNYNPEKNYNAAFTRRNWVINKMVANGYVTTAEAKIAKEKPLVLTRRDKSEYVNYPYFAEEVRRKLMELYGKKGLYEGGLIAHTTLVPEYQKIAEKALRNGLIKYDVRFGLHSSAIAHIDTKEKWQENLSKVSPPAGTGDLVLAVVLNSNDKKAVIGFSDGKKGVIPYDKMKWARSKAGVTPLKASDLLKAGDVWLVESANKKENGKEDSLSVYWLRQIPKIQGGIIAMDPHTGRIFAMAGGFSYKMSEFNRATQALRQPGSSFKPFVYLTGLENGFTPATLVLDAPFSLDQGGDLGTWRPKNYSDDFLGPAPLRVGIEKSRNLMTIRLASYIGMDKISVTAKRFGIIDNMPPLLSMAVGAGETTLLRMITGYSSFVNGGKKVTSTLIDRVQDRNGKTVYVHDQRPCHDCGARIAWNGQPTPEIADNREQIADPRNMYQIVSILEGAVQRGTGIKMRSIGRPVAGKTGTTNESKDTWFIGFTPNIIVGVYIGFDDPKPMGAKETGSRVALPVVKEFMEQTLKDVLPVPFRVPEGIRLVKINALTGTRIRPEDETSILEAFLVGTEPGDEPTMFTGHGISPVSDLTHAGESEDTGLGGLY